MGYIVWTKQFTALDNGTVLGGADLQNFQADITAIINGNITNINIASGAAILESKITFNTTTGHTHNGTDSKLVSPMKHYIRGGKITRTDTTNLTVGPICIDVGGTLLTSVAASSAIDVAGLNYITPHGGSIGSEPADGPIYILAYDNSGTVGFKLTTTAPTLSYDDDTTAEFPLRYIQDDAHVYYRYIGLIHNRTDLIADSMVYADSQIAIGSFISDNANETITTLWTPRYIKVWSPADTAPDTTDVFAMHETFEYGEKTADPHIGGASATAEVAFQHGSTATKEHQLITEGTAGNITDITQQSTSAAGSFVIYAPTNGIAVYWVAYRDAV